MAEVPVIFCFDDRILTGAGVSILSLVETAAQDTTYDIRVLHPGLDPKAEAALASLVAGTRHRITFQHVPASRFDGVPRNKGSWTEIVYYRLLASELLPDCDKAIYSDVDVLFLKDMGEVFATDLSQHELAAVEAEGNSPDNIMHRHFPENPKDRIWFSGFLVMNLDLMRRNNAVARYFEVIETCRDRLKFFDLDVLNIATPSIASVPFDYVVLEDIYEMPEVTESKDYPYLSVVHTDEALEAARQDPAILHYAGRRGKPWHRRKIPGYYADVMARLPARLRRPTLRDLRKRWLSRKGRRHFPSRFADL